MDKDRAIALVEGEIMRREALAKLGGFFAQDHLELAAALRETLKAYQRPEGTAQIPPFRAHNIRPVHVRDKKGKDR